MDMAGRLRGSLRLAKWLLFLGLLPLCYYLWKDALCDIRAYRKDWTGLLSCTYPLENPEISYKKALLLSYELKEEEAKNLLKRALQSNNLHLASLLLYGQMQRDRVVSVLNLVHRLFSPYQSVGNLRLSLAFLSGDPVLISKEASYSLALSKNRQDTLAIIWLYMGDKTLDVVPKDARKDYLRFLLSQGRWEEALHVWQKLEDVEKEEGLRCSMVDFLLSAGRLKEALSIWKEAKADKEQEFILNGSFEEEGETCGFGWHIQPYGTGYEISKDNLYAVQGSYSLFIRFDGSANPDFRGIYQILPLKDNTSYELSYFVKTQGITTNSGVYVELTCLLGGVVLSVSPQYLGDIGWKQERLIFRTPEGCGGVKLSIRRNPAERLERRIEGSLWLDAFSIREVSHDGGSN